MRRRLSNRPAWDPNADAAAESQLLSGLVTFRRKAAGQVDDLNKPGPFNTPSATIDLEFARQLQSLRLVNSSSIDEEDSTGATATVEANDDLSISTDLLVMAADGQLGQNLRWQQRQREQNQRRMLEQQRQHLALSLPLLGGRLNYFFQSESPTALDTSPPAVAPRPKWQQGRLAYRKSQPLEPEAEALLRVPPDVEIAQLLRSRTPTLILAEQRRSTSPEDASSTEVAKNPRATPMSQPREPPAEVAVKPRPVSSASTGDLSKNMDSERRLIVHGETAVISTEVREANSQKNKSDEPNKIHEVDSNHEFLTRRQQQKRLNPKKKQRRKVTGLEMLDNIEAKPQSLPSAPTPSSTPQKLTLTMQPTKLDSEKLTVPESTVFTRRKRKIRDQQAEQNFEQGSEGKDHSKDFSRSCSSHTDHECSRHFLSHESRQPSNIGSSVTEHHTDHFDQVVQTEKSLNGFFTESKQTDYREQADLQTQPSSDHASSVEPTVFELQKRPRPDQYRIAHRLAQAANQNAQFSTWLREGRDPAEFFSCRTSATGYYSYFPRLPRYDRGLQPFAEFATHQQQQHDGRRKFAEKPALLAYGGKNPDNYLPPPIIVRVRQPRQPVDFYTMRVAEKLDTTRQ